MKEIENLRFYVPLVFVASIFLGPIFNFLMFFYRKIPNSYVFFNISDFQFADIMAITFILFSFIFLITYNFSEKINNELAISLCLIIIGFNCIYAAFATTWLIYLITFIIIGATAGFVTPKIIDLMGDIARNKKKKRYHLFFIPICIIIWIFIYSIIFEVIGMLSWRILYIIIGITNILSSPLIIFYKGLE